MNLTILGGGLSGLSLAYRLQNRKDIEKITILEKEETCGGLCRTFTTNGIEYDVGPHIIFSKNKEVLNFMVDILGDNVKQLRRSNRILHKKRFVQYPFENDLSKLPEEDKEYCVNAFVHNPYENYEPHNMLQFFLKTFGEGITNTYLRPYNEKIWKYDPSFMDTQMVNRIPKPPKEDILRSASGETVDGYVHQLYFYYPKHGGTAAILQAIKDKFNSKVELLTGQVVKNVEKTENGFEITTGKNKFSADKIVSTLPVNELCAMYSGKTPELLTHAAGLRYNSIIICIVNVKKDYAGDNYAFMVADKNVKFHRVSKLDFMGEKYHKPDSVTYMAEITYRKNDLTDKSSDSDLIAQVVQGLQTIGFIDSEKDVNFADIRRFEYAYVIYDLKHRENMEYIRSFFAGENIYLNGRFGSFEYLNMDAVIQQSFDLAEEIC